MKQVFLAIIIALMTVGLYGQEPGAVQNEPKVRLKVVYEKTFDEEILDVIFDTATVSIEEAEQMGWKEEAFTEEEKAKGKVLVSYPKVVLISTGREPGWYVPERRNSYYTKELIFFDKEEILNRLVLGWEDGAEFVYLSPQKKYCLVSRWPTEWKPEYSGGILYDLTGKKIWEIDGPTPIAVSDEGYAVAAHLDWQIPPNPGGDFYVYNSKGKLLTTIENPLKEKTAPLFAEYSKGGEYAILSFKATTYPPTVFVLISKEGRILWKKELSDYRFPGRFEEIDIRAKAGIALANGFFIDWYGRLKWTQTLRAGGNRQCKFSQDGEKIYICSTSGDLWCLSKNTGKVIWAHKEPRIPTSDDIRERAQVPKFTEMCEQNHYVVVKGHPSKVFIFNSDTGKLKAKVEYPGKRIFLSLHNGRIFVIDVKGKRVLGLEVKEG